MRFLVLVLTIVTSITTFADDRQVLVISGMTSESAIAAGTGVVTLLSGGNPQALHAALLKMDAAKFRAVVSFGVAGGLSPDLRAGALVIGTGVVQNGVSLSSDTNLVNEITSLLKTARVRFKTGVIAAVNTPVETAADKLALGLNTGALTVDNESMEAATWANAQHLPFVVVRAVSDPQSLTLPSAIEGAINPDGSTNVGEVLSSLFQNPDQFAALIQTAFDSFDAFGTLKRVRSKMNFGAL